MFSTVYFKKAFVLKIPLHPPLPKGDNKDQNHIFMRFSPTHFHDEPLLIFNKKKVFCQKMRTPRRESGLIES